MFCALKPHATAAAALAFLALTTSPHAVQSGPVDPCQSTANLLGGPVNIAICPAGDGETLASKGAIVDIVARTGAGSPCPLIPPADIWLIECNGTSLVLCGGANSANADAATDASGATTMSGTVAGGGQETAVQVVIQGVILVFPLNCVDQRCLAIGLRSADLDGDNRVDIVDLANFGIAFPPNPHVAWADFNFDGVIGLVDLAVFAQHFGHIC